MRILGSYTEIPPAPERHGGGTEEDSLICSARQQGSQTARDWGCSSVVEYLAAKLLDSEVLSMLFDLPHDHRHCSTPPYIPSHGTQSVHIPSHNTQSVYGAGVTGYGL